LTTLTEGGQRGGGGQDPVKEGQGERQEGEEGEGRIEGEKGERHAPFTP